MNISLAPLNQSLSLQSILLRASRQCWEEILRVQGQPITQDVRAKIAQVALSKLGSQNWLDQQGHNQCNIFVHDVLKESGTTPPESDLTSWKHRSAYYLGLVDSANYPAQAGDWANPTKVLGCWKTLVVPANHCHRRCHPISPYLGMLLQRRFNTQTQPDTWALLLVHDRRFPLILPSTATTRRRPPERLQTATTVFGLIIMLIQLDVEPTA